MGQARHHAGYGTAQRPPVPAPGGGPDRTTPVADPAGDPVDGPETADELTRGLTHLGLTVHEAQMYRAVVRNGPVTARHAIAASQLDRATGYRILARLAARGLVVPTGRRPHRFVGLDVGRLLDRGTVFLRDEVDLHRVVRSIYLAETPVRGGPADDAEPLLRPPVIRAPLTARAHLIPKDEEFAVELIRRIGSARQEVQALTRPAILPEGARGELARALSRASERGVRVQLVLDYRTTDLEFLARLLPMSGSPGGRPDVRIWTPQLARLWVIDRRVAVRGFGAMSYPRPGGGPLVSSEDDEFVHQNLMRFDSIWREAIPLSLDARELAGYGHEPAPPTVRSLAAEGTRRVPPTHESAFRAGPSDGSGLALGRIYRA